MAERNFYAYQIDFQKLKKSPDGKETYSDFWNYCNFKGMIDDITSRNKNDIKKVHNGWFMLLDEIKEFNEKVNNTEHKYMVGRFLYAEYGYVGKLRHVDTLAQRDHDKDPREGEERFVYFYIRASDGLLLLQGDTKVIRSKVESYFSELGKGYLQAKGIYDISVSTLLRGDFLDEVKKLDSVNKIEIELAVEKANSYENELMRVAKKQAEEFEANYATIVMQSKYKKKSLKGFEKLLEKIKPRGAVAPVKGVSNIKVIGNQDGELKRVYLSKISEKYSRRVDYP
ncbi:hypothetical protein ABEU79_15575, partial [Geobacillus thermodenitrificans]|uniref:hypothetical protein n=1 Tax=Geobacillus thermodenitrificans TaxID=33940 RepID=UPI003D1F192A